MPVPPPAVMQPALSITRSSSTTGVASDQISRRVSLGLRTNSSGDSSTSSTNIPKETYNWRGQRYEVDEDTLPEWLEGATRERRKHRTPMDDAQREAMIGAPLAPIAQMVAPEAPQLIVKLPICLPAMVADSKSLASAHGSRPMDIDDPVSSEQAINSRSDFYVENGATTAEIKLLLDPPYVVEPDSTTSLWLEGATPELIAAHRKSTIEEFYGHHVFVCQFHTPITKFLRQLDSDYLKCLRPGSVRLTNKLSHMGFVHRGLQDFNQRSADGLRPDVAVMPVALENESNEVWVSWADVDDFDGLRGGWNAGEGTVAKRKPPARIFLDSNDDELYT